MSKSTKRRIGIYPGTFDPIHVGHIAFAEESIKVCDLDEVVFLPENTPRGKSNVTDITHRLAQIELATTGTPGLSSIWLDSKQFTIADTLPKLRSIYNDSRLTFLLGSDVAKSLHTWEGLGIILAEISFAIGMRSSDTSDEVHLAMHKLAAIHKRTFRFTLIHTQEAGISSSEIRHRHLL